MLAQLHDAGTRDLPGFGLKELARHFGVAAPDRTYIDASQVARTLREDPERLVAYAIDDAVETLGVAGVLAPPYFAQAQAVPFDYQACTLRGAAAKIDALMLREYLHRRHAVPGAQPAAPVGGGHTVICQQGVARPVLHVDVTSLYPSLMLAHSIAPASDALGVFPALLRHLRDFRVHAKRLARETADPAERAHLGALQQSFKILINAFYGYLAFSGGHWNDYDAANRVTAEGRAVVASLLERLTGLGATPIEADTDGVYFVPPPGHRPDDDDALLERVAAGLPSGLQLELDGRYAAMFSYKMKTYALLDERGRFSLKGSAFRSRGIEPFQRRIIEEVVRALLDGRPEEVRRIIDRRLDDFAAHRVDVRAFARTETLQESLDAYRLRVNSGVRPVSAVYELAATAGRALEPGDQISYYVTGRGAGVAVNEHAKLASQWDPTRPDENLEYYQAKVREIWERFRPFTEFDGLRPYVDEPEPQLSLFWSSRLGQRAREPEWGRLDHAARARMTQGGWAPPGHLTSACDAAGTGLARPHSGSRAPGPARLTRGERAGGGACPRRGDLLDGGASYPPRPRRVGSARSSRRRSHSGRRPSRRRDAHTRGRAPGNRLGGTRRTSRACRAGGTARSTPRSARRLRAPEPGAHADSARRPSGAGVPA